MVALAASPIAQIVIPMFSGPDLDGFATKIQNVVADLASKRPCGWIVDLRGNGGGNIWPMMAGVGPILGEGEPGGVLRASGAKDKWFYENGRAGLRSDTEHPYFAKTTGAPVNLKDAPPVAVLIDRETGSSGEGIAVAFRGRSGTRFFGETTYGVATSTFPYALSDGAQLFLVTGVMVDRKDNEYPLGVKPDQEILSDVSISTSDPVIRAASEWLPPVRGHAVPPETNAGLT
jgi:carboxyl-terminal processing protease